MAEHDQNEREAQRAPDAGSASEPAGAEVDGGRWLGQPPAESPSGQQTCPDAADSEESASTAGNVPEQVVGVVFVDGKVQEFDPAGGNYKVGDVVLVDNARDLNLGRIVYWGRNRTGQQLRRVKRRIGPQDWMLIRRNQNREEEAFELCQKLIAELGLSMKLIRVAYLHGGNKAIFYFSADGRVDFRELVRRLARALHVRIEMRQIGVRDESKMLGGVGICGQMLCCCRFLNKFVPVSIKMAKNQNLSLNPQKLSGLCGRLMCCLVFEDEIYSLNRRQLPQVGKTITTPRGTGKVVDLDVPRRLVKVELAEGVAVFTSDELAGKPPPAAPSPAEETTEKPEPEAPAATAAPPATAGPPETAAAQPTEEQKNTKRPERRKKRRSRGRSRRRRKKSREGASRERSGSSPGKQKS